MLPEKPRSIRPSTCGEIPASPACATWHPVHAVFPAYWWQARQRVIPPNRAVMTPRCAGWLPVSMSPVAELCTLSIPTLWQAPHATDPEAEPHAGVTAYVT